MAHCQESMKLQHSSQTSAITRDITSIGLVDDAKVIGIPFEELGDPENVPQVIQHLLRSLELCQTKREFVAVYDPSHLLLDVDGTTLTVVDCVDAERIIQLLRNDHEFAYLRFSEQHLTGVLRCWLGHLPECLIGSEVDADSLLEAVAAEEQTRCSNIIQCMVPSRYNTVKQILKLAIQARSIQHSQNHSSALSNANWIHWRAVLLSCFSHQNYLSVLHVDESVWLQMQKVVTKYELKPDCGLTACKEFARDFKSRNVTSTMPGDILSNIENQLSEQFDRFNTEPIHLHSRQSKSPKLLEELSGLPEVPCGNVECAKLLRVQGDIVGDLSVRFIHRHDQNAAPIVCNGLEPIAISIPPPVVMRTEALNPAPVAGINVGASRYLPHIDFASLDKHYELTEPVHANTRHSSDEMMSPRGHLLKRKLDVDLLENSRSQMVAFSSDAFFNSDSPRDCDKRREKLERKLKNAKKRLHSLEDSFSVNYGYRPNDSDKLRCEQMKKCVLDIADLKRQIRDLINGPLKVTPRTTVQNVLSEAVLADLPHVIHAERTFDQNVDSATSFIATRRCITGRPETVEDMTIPQVRTEKVLVQRLLLLLESNHGRPGTAPQRETVRDLYDRYSSLKRHLAGMTSPRTSLSELQPIPEHEGMHEIENIEEERNKRLSGDRLLFRPRFSTCGHQFTGGTSSLTERPDNIADDLWLPATNPCSHSMCASDSSLQRIETSQLHQMPPEQLFRKFRQLCEQKRTLKTFMSSLPKSNKSVAQDGQPLSTLQADYKHVRHKLRLVEALLSKHRASC